MNTPLQHAVWAVIARWESPAWKDMPHTGEYIDAMRKALAAEQAQQVAVPMTEPEIEAALLEIMSTKPDAQQVAVPARDCPYIGDPSRVCNKCGQRHGKPTFPQQVAVPVQMTTAEKSAAWVAATIEMPSHENYYLRGMLDAKNATLPFDKVGCVIAAAIGALK